MPGRGACVNGGEELVRRGESDGVGGPGGDGSAAAGDNSVGFSAKVPSHSWAQGAAHPEGDQEKHWGPKSYALGADDARPGPLEPCEIGRCGTAVVVPKYGACPIGV